MRLLGKLRPASVLQLLLIVLSLVNLPLIIGLVTTALSVDRLAAESQRAVLEAARIVQGGRILVEEVTAMERNARQFQALGDSDLHAAYLDRRQRFHTAADELAQLELDESLRERLGRLLDDEQRVYRIVMQDSPQLERAPEAAEAFPPLSASARSLVFDSSRFIQGAVRDLQTRAASLQQWLFWQTVAVIPAVLGLAALGTVLIAGPIQKVDRAIRRLGEGRFDQPVEVSGPRDLEALGQRLNWLRMRLAELDQQKTKFLQHVSHELKTPLTAIREGTQLLSDEVVGSLNPAQADIVGLLRESSVQLQKRIEDLVNFSIIARVPELFLDRQPVRLERLVEAVVNTHKAGLQAKGLKVHTRLDGVSLEGDARKLEAVIDNLLSNAIKYSPSGANMWIDLHSDGTSASLDIRDQGPGIDADEHGKVFEPFFQGRAGPPGGHAEGTGLGLAIAREYVRAHGGTIEIIDQPQGAHLRVELPLGDRAPGTSGE